MIFLAVKRRKFIRIVSYLTAVAVVFAASGYVSQRAKAGYEETLGKVRLTNLTALCEYSREIGSGLRVLAVSSGDSTADSMAFVRDRIMGAVGCLNTFSSKNVKHMSKFFNKVYGFAEDFTGTDAEREAAINLSLYAQEIYYHLNDVSSAVLGGAYSLTEYGTAYNRNNLPYFEKYLDYSNGREKELFEQISPASAQAGGYALLNGADKISGAAAKDFAGRLTGINSSLWRNSDGTVSGVALHSLKYGDVSVDICERGGVLMRLVNPMPCAKAFYSSDEAAEFAESFMARQGCSTMRCVGKSVNDFTADFVFAPLVNGVLLLNAQIRITVCRASGGITFFDASEYVENYRTDVFRKENEPDAHKLLPAVLTLRETVQCIAEINGKNRHCLLAVSSFDGGEVRSYVDFQSGRVIKTEIN